MNKPFEIAFKIDAKILAIIYVCWKQKYPISYFLTFYEMYGYHTLFILKALNCNKRIPLNDNALTNLIEESKILHKQILTGISTNMKIDKLENYVRNGMLIDEDIPERPQIDTSVFSEEYKEFVENYLLPNVKNIFSEVVTLRLSSRDLYQAVK